MGTGLREQWRENESGPMFLRESVAFMTRKGTDSTCLISWNDGNSNTLNRGSQGPMASDDPTRVSNTV